MRIFRGQAKDFTEASVVMSQKFIDTADDRRITLPMSRQSLADRQVLHLLQTFQIPLQGLLHMVPNLDIRRNVKQDVIACKENLFFGHIEAAQARRMPRCMNDRKLTARQVQDVSICDSVNRKMRVR